MEDVGRKHHLDIGYTKIFLTSILSLTLDFLKHLWNLSHIFYL